MGGNPPKAYQKRKDVKWVILDRDRRSKLAKWLESQKPEFGRAPSMNAAMSEALARWVDSLEVGRP